MRKLCNPLLIGVTLLCICLLWIPVVSAQSIDVHPQNGSGTNKEQNHFVADPVRIKSLLATTGFLVCPVDNAIGAFDPTDGTYLGDIIVSALLDYPNEALQGPDGNIYVVDSFIKSVFVFDLAGNYLYTYADSSDFGSGGGLYGIDFRDENLFIIYSEDFATSHVAEFDGPHSRLPDFISLPGIAQDILFLDDGSCLLPDSTSAELLHFDEDGNLLSVVFDDLAGRYTTQVTNDSLSPGDYLLATASYTDQNAIIRDFDIDGTVYQDLYSDIGGIGLNGIYRLANGNYILGCWGDVLEVEAGTGLVVDIELANVWGHYFNHVGHSVDIKVNGYDGNLMISAGDNAVVTIDLVAGDLAGIEHDVWVLAKDSSDNKYSCGVGSGGICKWYRGWCQEYYSGPLSNINETVFDAPLSICGLYKVYLGIDNNANGSLNIPLLVDYDMVAFGVIP